MTSLPRYFTRSTTTTTIIDSPQPQQQQQPQQPLFSAQYRHPYNLRSLRNTAQLHTDRPLPRGIRNARNDVSSSRRRRNRVESQPPTPPYTFSHALHLILRPGSFNLFMRFINSNEITSDSFELLLSLDELILRRGVSESVMNILKSTEKRAIVDDVNEQCAICLENYNVDDILMHLPCSHRFHTSCSTQWLRQHKTCPYCRNNVQESIASSTSLL